MKHLQSLIRNDENYRNDQIANCGNCSVKTQIFKQILSRFFYQPKNDFFIIIATNKDQIYRTISALNINKSCGPNSTPNYTISYTLLNIKFLNILQLYVTYLPLQKYFPLF